MRLYKYLVLSSENTEVSLFRSMGLHLVEDNTGNDRIIQSLREQNLLDDSAMSLLERANKELKRMYRGKLKFDFCSEEDGINPDELKLDEKKVKAIKEKWFKFNDELSSIQTKFEYNLKKSLHN